MPDENLQRSQPQNWFKPFRDNPSAKLAADETVAMILHMEINDSRRNVIAHNMFAVIRKGAKAIGRFIVSFDGNPNDSRSTDIAEYPIENQHDLINEVRNHGLMLGVAVLSGAAPFLSVNTEKPVYCLQTPDNATNEKILERFASETDPNGITAQKVITEVLGLKPDPLATSEINGHRMTMQVSEDLKPTSNLQKAAAELELIKKYGEKPMLELAKKMGYQGEIINQPKTKEHAN
jgi:hypothetical protein